MEVIDDGKALRCECGVIGSDANDLLKPYNRKIGPDPATLATALVGGILNNNSSGMCCGTAQNSYKTIRSIRVVLLDGSILDTSDKRASINSSKKNHKWLKIFCNCAKKSWLMKS